MRDLLIYGNSPGRWLWAGTILLAGILLLYVLRRLVMNRLERVALRTTTQVDDFGVDLLRRTRFFFVFALARQVCAASIEIMSGWVGTTS